MIALNFHPY